LTSRIIYIIRRCCSALKDAYGNYVLNGNFIVSAFNKELHVSGSILEYSGSASAVERINGSGMLHEDINLQVNIFIPLQEFGKGQPYQTRKFQ